MSAMKRRGGGGVICVATIKSRSIEERGSRCLLTITNAGGDAQPALLMATHRQQDAEVGRRGDDEGNGSPERFREL